MHQTSIAQRLLTLPKWVPTKVQKNLSGQRISIKRLPPVIRRRMRTPEKIKVSKHAALYRVVTDGPHSGPWRHEYAPHTKKIMDTFGLPWVREVWFCGVDQSGKTNTMLNCMSWAVDIAPGDVFYLMPTEKTSAKVTGDKIIPMLKRSPRLARYVSDRQDDTGLMKIKLKHGVTIRPAWANSAASMATFPAKYCFGDEVDKMSDQVGRETDPINVIRKRNRQYKGLYKRMFCSTPAGVFIYKNTMACPQVWEYRVRCQHCDQLIKMDGENLCVDDMTVEKIESGEKVLYACNECGVQWDDIEREQAIRSGMWVCVKGADVLRPTRVGFYHRAFECLDVPLAEIGVAWIRQQNGTVADRIGWANGYEAKDYSYEQQDREEEFILRLVDKSMPREVVPRDVSCLVLLADTQRVGFYYQVWAYGWGGDLTTWRIDHGFVETFQHLKDIAAKSWFDADQKEYRIQAALIDSGGGTNPHNPKHSRTVEVYEFCRQNPLFKPLKGRRSMAQPWNVTRLDYYPGPKGKKIPIPGGLTLYTIDVTLYKNELSRKLAIEPNDPGAFHLHADIGDDYAKQMCAEYQDDHGWWVCPKHKPNHHWDIGVYGMAAADIYQIRTRRKDGDAPKRRVYSKGVSANG